MKTPIPDPVSIPTRLASIRTLTAQIAQLQADHATLSGWFRAHTERDRSAEKASPNVKPAAWKPGQGDTVTYTGGSPANIARTDYLLAQIAATAAEITVAQEQLAKASVLESLA